MDQHVILGRQPDNIAIQVARPDLAIKGGLIGVAKDQPVGHAVADAQAEVSLHLIEELFSSTQLIASLPQDRVVWVFLMGVVDEAIDEVEIDGVTAELFRPI